jgi:hypothetical protein
MTYTEYKAQVRAFTGVDSAQYSDAKLTYSYNNWLNRLTGYAIGADQRFQWDNTNHTKLPIGTTNLVANQREYSFLTDEQGNQILTLTRIDWKDANGLWTQLKPIDQAEISPEALDEFEKTSARPMYYDKIADNVIRLYPASDSSVTAGLKFYFQRTSPYAESTDTTEVTGFANLLDRGFVISGAYDCAIALGLPNLNALGAELSREEQKMIQYFGSRNRDERNSMKVFSERKEQWL